MRDSWYDTAQICLSGHIVNNSSIRYPLQNQSFCQKCGEKTITKCQKCDAKIRGEYHVEGVAAIGFIPTADSYCHECGNPFPWTEGRLEAAKELADLLDHLDPKEIEDLKKSLDDLVKDGPRTVVATTKFKRIVSKTGPEIYQGFKDILVDVVSETVKKAIWGQ